MTALEIVLTSVLGGLLLVAIFYYLVFKTNMINRQSLFTVINETARENSIIFFGDSLTDFFPIQDFFPGYIIYNRGIAGDTTRDLLRRLDDIIVIKPRKVFIQIGTNDLGKNVKPQVIVNNIKTITKRLKAEVPGVEIYIISLYPVSHRKLWVSPVITGVRSNKTIVATNELLKALCAENNLPYIDIHPLLIDPKGRLDARYTIEGLHISGAGYGVIASALKPYLD